jgi:hypothetical protein
MDDQPTLFDDQAAARDNAIDRAEEHADVAWRQAAYDSGRRLAAIRATLISEDIFASMAGTGLATHEPRAMGAIMRRLHKDGLIEPTDRFVTSPSPVGHKRPSRVWRSRVCR